MWSEILLILLIISMGFNCYFIYPRFKSKYYPAIRNGIIHRDIKHVKGNIYGIKH